MKEILVMMEQLPNGMSIPVGIFKDRHIAQEYEDFQREINSHRKLFTFAVDVEEGIYDTEGSK